MFVPFGCLSRVLAFHWHLTLLALPAHLLLASSACTAVVELAAAPFRLLFFFNLLLSSVLESGYSPGASLVYFIMDMDGRRFWDHPHVPYVVGLYSNIDII